VTRGQLLPSAKVTDDKGVWEACMTRVYCSSADFPLSHLADHCSPSSRLAGWARAGQASQVAREHAETDPAFHALAPAIPAAAETMTALVALMRPSLSSAPGFARSEASSGCRRADREGYFAWSLSGRSLQAERIAESWSLRQASDIPRSRRPFGFL
jgi:hypothetical protein